MDALLPTLRLLAEAGLVPHVPFAIVEELVLVELGPVDPFPRPSITHGPEGHLQAL
ncbi:hypothetical protein [Streptomyces sp. NPDC060205]|uniref:hypothetical protein n=1 Tax=Streptomyces sp. NPDC060205 TaxID=3347072 RepID=UPI00364B5210